MPRSLTANWFVPLVAAAGVGLGGVVLWSWSVSNGDPQSAADGGTGDDGAADDGGQSSGQDGASPGGSGAGGASPGDGPAGPPGSGVSPGGTAGSGSADGGAGGGAGGVAASPPPPGGLCGPAEFLGGLIPFVQALGSPNLLPKPLSKVLDVPIGPSGPVAGPIGGALVAPLTIVSGFNQAYMPLADAIPDECGGITGDPHIRTHDGLRYDFQAVGEYWALRSADGSVAVQIRTLPYGRSGSASTVRGVAARVDGRVVVVDPGGENPVTVDGEAVLRDALSTDNGGSIFVMDEGVAVVWPDRATTLTVGNIDGSAISSHFTLGASLRGDVVGLMGNADGDPSNDLTLADGAAIDVDFATIHGPFREAWRVSAADSLFAGPSVYRADFPTAEATLTSGERDAARDVCVRAGVIVGGLLEDCIFDVAVSGADELAEIHASNQRPRVLIKQAACALELSGDAVMEGFGPARSWQAAPAELGGERVWTFALEQGQPLISRVLPAGARAAVIDTRNGVHLIDESGQIELTAPLSPIADVEPLIVGDSVFVATEEGLAALRVDGSICWHLLTHADEAIATLGFASDRILATTEADAGGVSVALAVEPQTGAVLWTTMLQARVRQFGAGIPPVLSAGLAVFESVDGGVIALDLNTGAPVWEQPSLREGDSLSALSMAGGLVLVVGRRSGLWAVDPSTGELRWTMTERAGVPRDLAADERIALLVSEEGAHGVEVSSGRVLWFRDDLRYRGATKSAVVSGSRAYLYADRRLMVGIDLATGNEVSRLDLDLGSPSANSNRPLWGPPVIWRDLFMVVDRTGLVAYR